MRLDRQAHLYDRFPQTTSRLSCLRATVPAHGYKYDDSHVSISHCNATHPRVRKAVGVAHTSMTNLNRYVRQYRGTQPHSTESTMTSNDCFLSNRVIHHQTANINTQSNIIDKE